MAQPSGFKNIVPPVSGANNSGTSGFISNGQPPQWGKPPLGSLKHCKQPNNPYLNQSMSRSSNGTPTHPSLNNSGSLSSHSSRDPSPIPSNCLDSMSRSHDVALHSQHQHSSQSRYSPFVLSSSLQPTPNNQQSPQQPYSQIKPKVQSAGDGAISAVQQHLKDGFDASVNDGQRQKLNLGQVVSSAQIQHSGIISDSPSRNVQVSQNAVAPSISQIQSYPPSRHSHIYTNSNISQVAHTQHYSSTVHTNSGSSSFQINPQTTPVLQPAANGPHGDVPSFGVDSSRHSNKLSPSRTDNVLTESHQRQGQDRRPYSNQDVYGIQSNSNQHSQHSPYPSVNSSDLHSPAIGRDAQGFNQKSLNPYMPVTSRNQFQFLPVSSSNKIDQASNPQLFQGGSSSSGQQMGMPAPTPVKPPSTVTTPLAPPPINQPLHNANPSRLPPPTSLPSQYPPVSSQNYRYPNPINSGPPNLYGGSASNNQTYEQPPPIGSIHRPPGPQIPNQHQPIPNPHLQSGLGNSSSSYLPSGAPPLQSSYPVQQEGQHVSKRYPQQPNYSSNQAVDGLVAPMGNLSVTQQGFNKLWGLEFYDLLQTRNILPPDRVEAPKVKLHQEFLDNLNCSPDIFRCTLTRIPESNSLLQKSRLPLGILIHPFKDLNHLPVIQCSTIVRCRVCRTYIHPFVHFVDNKHWKCSLCFRVNELPEEFQYDPVSKTYGDPTRRPEVKSSTIEFIAPSEYMLRPLQPAVYLFLLDVSQLAVERGYLQIFCEILLDELDRQLGDGRTQILVLGLRPPQPAVYLFLLDVSQLAVECGYLQIFCEILLDELDRLPGDGRTQIGFITFDSSVHFYNLSEGLSQPQQMIVLDTDDVFLPCPDNLLVNLAESRELVRDLLQQLPQKFQTSYDNRSALGAALQAAYKLMAPTGGRISVFQSCLPTMGPGGLAAREDPNQRSGKDAPHLNPATDFYKLLALDCSGQQVAVDLFLINSQYCDLATTSGISRFSGGCIYHFPLFKASNILQSEHFERVLRRYFTRKIGFEAVMRIRCSRGLAIHTFHGNFFVRSTDLLSLPNVNPDAGFGMQVSIEENLSELQNICFQAALLYTTSKGERRIRVHTLCLPVATTLPDILHSADQQCIVGLLAKMAVDRSHQSSLSDARDAFINVAVDVLSAYRAVQPSGPSGALLAPHNLRLLPLYILALLKYVAFRTGQSTRLDDRVFAMCNMKTLPLASLIQAIYPDLYPVHCLEEQLTTSEDGTPVPQPPRLHLSAEKLDYRGAFLLDTGDHMMLYVGRNVASDFCTDVLGVPGFSHIPEDMYELPVLEKNKSENMRNFINRLQGERPFCATLEVIRDDSAHRVKFTERLLEDRTESALSYYEFLQHLKANVK